MKDRMINKGKEVSLIELRIKERENMCRREIWRRTERRGRVTKEDKQQINKIKIPDKYSQKRTKEKQNKSTILSPLQFICFHYGVFINVSLYFFLQLTFPLLRVNDNQ